MTKLTAKEESFIKLMKKNPEHAQRGFRLLLERREDFEIFFDVLQEECFFDPKQNPAPQPADEPGYVRIPYWAALDYLAAVAKRADERHDLLLANKVMQVVRNVSRAQEPDGSDRDNYHTWRMFADILGLLPTTAVTKDDLDLIPIWLKSRYDRSLVAYALSKGLLQRSLENEQPEARSKACVILRHCTAIEWVDETSYGKTGKKPMTIVDDYHLKKIIDHHARTLGAKTGRNACKLFLERVQEVFGHVEHKLPSWLFRPAVEEHPQNHSWKSAENIFVVGLRDVLLGWLDHAPSDARAFIKSLLQNELEIVRRIAIYLLNVRWDVLGQDYALLLDTANPFDTGHLHELYGLLRNHFAEMPQEQKEATLEAIRSLPQPTKGEDRERHLRHIRNWLSALVGKGYKPADTWFQELDSDLQLGRLSEHPDFHTYMESSLGPGPSPYRVEELILFADDGSLVAKLNAFEQMNHWGTVNFFV